MEWIESPVYIRICATLCTSYTFSIDLWQNFKYSYSWFHLAVVETEVYKSENIFHGQIVSKWLRQEMNQFAMESFSITEPLKLGGFMCHLSTYCLSASNSPFSRCSVVTHGIPLGVSSLL